MSSTIRGRFATSPSIEKTPSIDDQRRPIVSDTAKPFLEHVHVVVGVLQNPPIRKPRAVEDAGVIEIVQNHHILAIDQA